LNFKVTSSPSIREAEFFDFPPFVNFFPLIVDQLHDTNV
jgi:hypothetical protein